MTLENPLLRVLQTVALISGQATSSGVIPPIRPIELESKHQQAADLCDTRPDLICLMTDNGLEVSASEGKYIDETASTMRCWDDLKYPSNYCYDLEATNQQPNSKDGFTGLDPNKFDDPTGGDLINFIEETVVTSDNPDYGPTDIDEGALAAQTKAAPQEDPTENSTSIQGPTRPMSTQNSIGSMPTEDIDITKIDIERLLKEQMTCLWLATITTVLVISKKARKVALASLKGILSIRLPKRSGPFIPPPKPPDPKTPLRRPPITK